jgi:hypothetical protein
VIDERVASVTYCQSSRSRETSAHLVGCTSALMGAFDLRAHCIGRANSLRCDINYARPRMEHALVMALHQTLDSISTWQDHSQVSNRPHTNSVSSSRDTRTRRTSLASSASCRADTLGPYHATLSALLATGSTRPARKCTSCGSSAAHSADVGSYHLARCL